MSKNNNTATYTISVIAFSIISLMWSSCEKVVDFNLKDAPQQLVVEGRIETNQPPTVRLSKSIGFFNKVSLKNLVNSYIHGVDITVSNGQQSVNLVEYKFSQNGLPYYIYTLDTTDLQAQNFLGHQGEHYDLTIHYKDKKYTATTYIPFVKGIDSIWSEQPKPEDIPKDYPDSRLVYLQYTDPDTPGNRVRYFVKRNKQPFLAPIFSVYDDELVNGTTVQIPMFPGYNQLDTTKIDNYGYFSKGDTVILKWCEIDKATFNFWNTLEYSRTATGNPFASPVEITTNIKGGALGVWAGYAPSYDTLIIDQ